MKKNYRHIFVVLTYKNTDDIIDFIKSVNKNVENFRIIIVNSYYDKQSDNKLKKISKDQKCDFITVENKGYGYGNNRGIEFAMSRYMFEYLVVANPDTLITKFDTENLSNSQECLIGPMIHGRNMKNQNPYWFNSNRLTETLIYIGYKFNIRLVRMVGIVWNKISREFHLAIFKLGKKTITRVFALHGSFVIFPSNLLNKINLPYDENIFLFAEESDLAHKLSAMQLTSKLTKDIHITHKEDGSMDSSETNQLSERRRSVIYYFEKHRF